MKAYFKTQKHQLLTEKVLAFICMTALVLSMGACSKSADYAGTTITGKVTAIKDTTVTLQLGELSDNENKEDSRPDMPEKPAENDNSTGDASESSKHTDSETAVEGTPPQKPDNDGPDSRQTPPEMPDNGSSAGGQMPPEMPSGAQNGAPSGNPGPLQTFTAGDETIRVDLSDASIVKDLQAIEVSDISEDDILQITFNDKNEAKTVIVISLAENGAKGIPSDMVTQGSSANTITEAGTYSGESYCSTGDDENALRIEGAEVTLQNITVDKNAGATSNTENGDFYGVNAALLVTNGATVTIKNAIVTSSAQNGNGVFSYGSGTTVNIYDSEITTTSDNSGGIQTTGGGTTNAGNLTVHTSGNSSAAIRSDRGGGTVNVNGGTYTSDGYNSPAVYSTAAITVADATLSANNSEALVIEGKNSIALANCTVYGNMSDTKGSSSDENVHNIMIYQSMSGDADVGTSVFSMTGGSLTSNNGDMFYITNTACNITLSDVTIVNKDSDAYLMNICGNSASHGWGTAGKNGAQVVFSADGQILAGDIAVDTISTLNMTLKGNSTFTGTINITENKEGGTAVSDNAVITVESGSTWNLTGNCTVTSLTNNGTVNFNGYTITLADGTVLK